MFRTILGSVQVNSGKNKEIQKQSDVKFRFNRNNLEFSRIFLAVLIALLIYMLISSCTFIKYSEKFTYSYKSIWKSRVGTKLLWAIQKHFWLYQGFLKIEIFAWLDQTLFGMVNSI